MYSQGTDEQGANLHEIEHMSRICAIQDAEHLQYYQQLETRQHQHPFFQRAVWKKIERWYGLRRQSTELIDRVSEVQSSEIRAAMGTSGA